MFHKIMVGTGVAIPIEYSPLDADLATLLDEKRNGDKQGQHVPYLYCPQRQRI
jgi:hypothetical protein